MEHENAYSSNGKGNLGVTLGAIGTGLGLMSGGLGNVGGLFGGAKSCSEDHTVNRYELGLQQEVAAKDTKIALLESNIYTDAKISDVYERLNTKFDGKIACLEGAIAQQAVYNATNTGTLSCLQGQVAALQALTKTIVPITNVCPEPMALYNSWTAPTATAGA